MDDGSGQPKIVELPLTRVETDSVRVETTLTVGAEGHATGESKVANTGVFDLVARQVFAINPGNAATLADRLLQTSGQTGSGSYFHSARENLTRPFGYVMNFHLDNYIQLPGPGAITIPSGLGSFSNIAYAFEMTAPPARDFAIPFVGGHREEITKVLLPDSTTILALPKPFKLDTPFGHYESNYVRSDSGLVVRRMLDLQFASATLSAEDYVGLRTMWIAIARDLKSQVVYQ
ncbi:MAG TPA: hypothetical protein VFW00_06135 [Rhodocyclaceae bacterium]|nr:hypothetical protein [Rhodocyclaceae bacterium]